MSSRVNETEFGTAHMSPIETYMIRIDTELPTHDVVQPHRLSWALA
jgi:hypothetical protein